MRKNHIFLLRTRIIKSLLAMYCVIACSFTTLFAKEQIYLMPYEQQEALQELLYVMKHAQKRIDIAIYSFTNREIAKALRDASSRGVTINIIYDMGQKNTNNSTIGYLEKFQNIHTCLLEGNPAKNGKYKGIMHHKMIIVDDEIIGLGSANWSKNAFENNYESLYFTDSKEVINKANEYYKKMLQACIPFAR